MPDRSPARVSVIIPVFRFADDVAECLASLRHAGDKESPEIIVVDDCSGDGTAEMIEDRFPEVTLVRRATNGGFARAVNTGVAHASAESRFVAMLNSDATVEPGWLGPAVEAMQRDESIGSVAPRIVLHDDPSIIDSAGHGYTVAGWAYRRGHGQPFGPPFNRTEPIFGATGSAVVFRRQALIEQPYVFREELGCYYEDTELAFRLQVAGWRCLYVPHSVVRHKVSRHYGGMAAHKTYHVSRNLEIVFWEYMPAVLFWRAVWDHLLFTLMHGASKTVRRQGLAWLKGKLAFLARLPGGCGDGRRRPDVDRVGQWVERQWVGNVMRYRARGARGSSRSVP
ncbi:MAG: glycosyltransferase family 2 protein [Planctomycetota bacterium]|jgi:GT2 family glycosyltransferase